LPSETKSCKWVGNGPAQKTPGEQKGLAGLEGYWFSFKKTSTFTVIASTIMVFMEHSSDSLLWSKTSSHKKTNCLEANSDLLMRLECLVSAITFSEVIAIDVFLSCRLNPS